MRVRSLVASAFLWGALSGCMHLNDEGGGGSRAWSFGGVFGEEATQEDMADFGRRMADHGGDVLLMESFPVQFSVRDLTAAGCPEAHAEAAGLAYVRSVSDCRSPTPVESPDAPIPDT